jgi:hypothetical protein
MGLFDRWNKQSMPEMELPEVIYSAYHTVTTPYTTYDYDTGEPQEQYSHDTCELRVTEKGNDVLIRLYEHAGMGGYFLRDEYTSSTDKENFSQTVCSIIRRYTSAQAEFYNRISNTNLQAYQHYKARYVDTKPLSERLTKIIENCK